jgi:hypothetical protein
MVLIISGEPSHLNYRGEGESNNIWTVIGERW